MIKNHTKNKIDKIVLVGVLKSKRDLNILLTENWYRIPVAYAPTQRFNYLAFYQPALSGCIVRVKRAVQKLGGLIHVSGTGNF